MLLKQIERIGIILERKLRIAGYCRISVDDELDRDNTSIENQKSIIEDYVSKHFPAYELKFYVELLLLSCFSRVQLCATP